MKTRSLPSRCAPRRAGVPAACATLACLLSTSTVFAQRATDGPQQDPTDGPRRIVDPAVEDVGPLSRSLRLLDPGIGLPGSFERVEQVPGHDELYMRIAGGLYAVFPRSLYVPTRAGDAALIPNDTIFYIGPPPLLSEPMPPRPIEPESPRTIGSGSRVLHAEQPDGPQPGDPDFQPSIAEPTVYRSARLMELMRRAGAVASNERQRPPDRAP